MLAARVAVIQLECCTKLRSVGRICLLAGSFFRGPGASLAERLGERRVCRRRLRGHAQPNGRSCLVARTNRTFPSGTCRRASRRLVVEGKEYSAGWRKLLL